MTYIFLWGTVVELVWNNSDFCSLLKLHFERSRLTEVVLNFVLPLVATEGHGSLGLLTVLVHQNLLLVVEAHANVGVVYLLVLCHIRKVMLELCF